MNTNTIFAFVAGIVVGVGGTLITDHIINGHEDEDEEYDDSDEVNPAEEYIPKSPESSLTPVDDEKPSLNQLVDYGSFYKGKASLPQNGDFIDKTMMGNIVDYKELVDQVNPENDPRKEQLIAAAVEKVAGVISNPVEEPEDEEEPSLEDDTISDAERVENLFDNEDVVVEPAETEYDRSAKIPPAHRDDGSQIKNMDIVQITAYQYMHSEEFPKRVVTYYEKEGILAGYNDKLDKMDIMSTIGFEILNVFELDDQCDVLFVSNLSTEIDYEIDRSYDSYQDDYNEIMAALGESVKDDDEVCQEEKQ